MTHLRLAVMAALLLSPTLAWGQADLSLSVEGPIWLTETKAQFAVTITNVGDLPYSYLETDPIDVSFFFDSAAKPDPQSSLATETDVLATFIDVGGKSLHVFEYDYEVAGAYMAWFFVDSFGIALAELGIPDQGAPETPKSNNVISKSFDVVLSSTKAELVLAGFTATTIASGQKVLFQPTVQNTGGVMAPDGFKVDVLIDPPGGECPPTQWKTVPSSFFGQIFVDVPGGLAPGESKTLTPVEYAPSPGPHIACAMVDLDDIVDEGDETTNNVFGPVQFVIDNVPDVPKCDLDVTKWKVSPVGAQVSYDVCVTNIGDAPCSSFLVDLWYHSITEPAPAAQPASHSWVVGALAVGEQWCDSHLQDPPPPSGQYQAWVWADAVAATGDTQPDNNHEQGYPYTVIADSDCPNLTVVDVEWTQVADQLHYDVTIRNKGTQPAKDVPVTLFYSFDQNPECFLDDLSSTPLDEVVIADLPAGAQETWSFIWTAPTPGEHTAWVKIDCLNTTQECDTTDNDFGPVATEYVFTPTQGVDLELVSFQSFVDCTNVNYTVKVRNRGDEPSPPFAVALYQHRETNPNFDDANWDFVCYTPSNPQETDKSLWLQPGDVVECQYTWEEATPGTWKSWAVVDPANTITEEDLEGTAEGNNITWVDFTVDHEACRCPENEAIDTVCACGTITVTEGYCCNSEWQFEPFATCFGSAEGDNPAGDNGGQPHDDLSGGGGGDAFPGGDLNSGGNGSLSVNLSARNQSDIVGGCAQSASPGSPLALALLILLSLLGLALSRRAKSPRPARIRRRRR